MEKFKKFKEILKKVEKIYGQGALMFLGEENEPKKIEVFKTGSISLDRAIGIGGYPKGRVIEIFGNESSGKTTLCLHAIAEMQKEGGVCAFIDAEHSLDLEYARSLGVDVSSLLIAQPSCGEEALGICEILLTEGGVDLVVIDSVAALVPKAEIEGTMEDNQIGLQARMMSKALRKLTAVANRKKATVIFINQIRNKIGITYGNSLTTTGGNALKFYASLRIEVKKSSYIKNSNNEIVGVKTVVKVVKNKLSAPFKTAEFEIEYGKGINWIGELVDLAVTENLVTKSGSWYSFGEIKLGQGKENVVKFLSSNPDIVDNLKKELFALEKAA